MTTVPGTYFTQEQLEVDLKGNIFFFFLRYDSKQASGLTCTVDNVSCWGLTGSWKMNNIGYKYKNEKRQYNKALAWYLLAARKNDSTAQNNIGVLYYEGKGVPKNYLCALKWYLKSAQQNSIGNTASGIGKLFENGYGVPLDKYKALEWYCRDKIKTDMNRLNAQGYHRYEKDKKKSLQQLRKEAEAILEAEKTKLEEKPDKTQEEIETLEQLNITYKLTDGGNYAWNDVPILLAGSEQQSVKSANSFVTNNEDEILELKKQIQLLKRNTFDGQPKQLESLKQEKPNIELQTKENDNGLISLNNDNQLLQYRDSTVQHQITINDSKINLFRSENQELMQKINSLEQQVKEKDAKIKSVLTENHSLKHRIDALEQENRMLKQERIQQQATVQNTGPSNDNISPTNINAIHHNQLDDSHNDLNYETDNSDTEEGDADDINYDTPSEDEDSNNDLNYDESE